MITSPASGVSWLQRCDQDVPADDSWLSPRELAVQSHLVVPPRRVAWRLGRWTAKAAVAAVLEVHPSRVSVVAAADGAPEPYLDDMPCSLSLSISHRGGLGFAAIGVDAIVGADLEVIEPRSDAFIREWFGDGEQRLIAEAREASRPDPLSCLLPCLLWSAKEATAKVLREGLRLDPRGAVVSLGYDPDLDEATRRWQRFAVDWGGQGPSVAGWWCTDGSFARTIAATPECARPKSLC